MGNGPIIVPSVQHDAHHHLSVPDAVARFQLYWSPPLCPSSRSLMSTLASSRLIPCKATVTQCVSVELRLGASLVIIMYERFAPSVIMYMLVVRSRYCPGFADVA